MSVELNINDSLHRVEVEGDTPLLWVLRDVIGLTGTKFGCGIAMCGACTVHVDGKARRSCVTPIDAMGGASIHTIENLGTTREGKALQRAWLDLGVVQCGYCQSGQLMSAASLLAANHAPSDDDINTVMSGNICRCGTYGRIRQAIKLAARYLSTGSRQAGDPTRITG